LLAVTVPVLPWIDSISLTAEGQVLLLVGGAPGHYAIEASGSPATPTPGPADWTELTNLVISTTPFQYLDAETNLAQRYYRVRYTP
jgi:hypothetical protein